MVAVFFAYFFMREALQFLNSEYVNIGNESKQKNTKCFSK